MICSSDINDTADHISWELQPTSNTKEVSRSIKQVRISTSSRIHSAQVKWLVFMVQFM